MQPHAAEVPVTASVPIECEFWSEVIELAREEIPSWKHQNAVTVVYRHSCFSGTYFTPNELRVIRLIPYKPSYYPCLSPVTRLILASAGNSL